MKSAKFAATMLASGPWYSPWFQFGSRRMESMIILRSMRLRPPISTGDEAHRLAEFRRIRDQIAQRLSEFVEGLKGA